MTISIKKMSAVGSGNTIRIDIAIESGEYSEQISFRILSSQYALLKLSKEEISRELYEELEESSRICDAYLKAMNILSFGSNTAHTLTLKLRRRGFDAEIAEKAVKMIRDKGYLSEEDDLRRDIEHCIGKRWGSRRILAHLRSRGYDDETLSLADDELERVDFGEICLELLENRIDEVPSDPRERQKVVAFLSRYGYTMSEIRYALSNFEE